jgi:hypothetical protein
MELGNLQIKIAKCLCFFHYFYFCYLLLLLLLLLLYFVLLLLLISFISLFYFYFYFSLEIHYKYFKGKIYKNMKWNDGYSDIFPKVISPKTNEFFVMIFNFRRNVLAVKWLLMKCTVTVMMCECNQREILTNHDAKKSKKKKN